MPAARSVQLAGRRRRGRPRRAARRRRHHHRARRPRRRLRGRHAASGRATRGRSPRRSATPRRAACCAPSTSSTCAARSSTEHVRPRLRAVRGGPAVRLVSLMDHTPGQRQFVQRRQVPRVQPGQVRAHRRPARRADRQRRQDQARYGERHRAAIVRLCHKHGLPLASHDDATVGPRRGGGAGRARSIAEFPTTLEAAAGRARLRPRGGGRRAEPRAAARSHSGNVAAAELAAAGLLDILSSDYVPASAAPRRVPAAHAPRLSLPAAIATVTATPAERVGARATAARSCRGGAPTSSASGSSRGCRWCAECGAGRRIA